MSRLPGRRGPLEWTYVACQVGRTLFALPVESIREITLPGELVHLPREGGALLGATEHRGGVLPVVDLGVLLSGERVHDTRAKWILVGEESPRAALVVARVYDVFRVKEGDIRPSAALGEGLSHTTGQVVAHSRGVAFVLDTAALFRALEPSALAGAVPEGPLAGGPSQEPLGLRSPTPAPSLAFGAQGGAGGAVAPPPEDPCARSGSAGSAAFSPYGGNPARRP